MNTEKLTQLANDLDSHDEPEFKFDIGIVARQQYEHEGCGTVGCITGFIMWKYLGARYNEPPAYSSMHPELPSGTPAQDWDAGAWLELPPPVWDQLFYGFNRAPSDLHITPQHSAKVIRHLRDTGVVDWRILEGEGA
jgi:hypothetical protein